MSSTTTTSTATAPSSCTKPIYQLPTDQAEEALKRFQTFVRFETVSNTGPYTGAYQECAAFLKHELQSLNIFEEVFYLPESPDNAPVVVAHWKGKDPTLPVLLLNSHYDVVPADMEKWTVPPFEAIRKDGRIYGRGTQDMKCVCLQYMEAIRILCTNEEKDLIPERSVYLTYVPDEEVGGAGMAAFLDSTLYKTSLTNGIALALDEGLASTSNTMDIFYGERLPWWIDVTATGPTGHGSRFIDNTAVEQLLELTQKAMKFRQGQRDQLGMKHDENCTHAVVAAAAGGGGARQKTKATANTLGDVTSLNITTLEAGVRVGDTYAYNCVPPIARCSLDIRISPNMKPIEMKELLDTWCQECSLTPGAVTWSYIKDQNSSMEHATTNTDPAMNPWYAVVENTMRGIGIELVPQVFPAATDSRFLRALGIRALGFSPMRNTEILLHEHDEYIMESTYLEGIGVYVELIGALIRQGGDMK